MIVPMSRKTSVIARFRTVHKPETNAVVIYMMDVSGSMGEEQKQIVRLTAFWLDTWLTTAICWFRKTLYCA